MGVIQNIGASLKELLKDIDAAPAVYFGDPGFEGIDSLPAVVIGVPAGTRRAPDEAEDHLGQIDWNLDYPVAIICDLGIAAESQETAMTILEQSIQALEDNHDDLHSSVLDAVLASWENPEVIAAPKRPLLTLAGTIQVLAFS